MEDTTVNEPGGKPTKTTTSLGKNKHGQKNTKYDKTLHVQKQKISKHGKGASNTNPAKGHSKDPEKGDTGGQHSDMKQAQSGHIQSISKESEKQQINNTKKKDIGRKSGERDTLKGPVKILKARDKIPKEFQRKESKVAEFTKLQEKHVQLDGQIEKQIPVKQGNTTFVECYFQNFKGRLADLIPTIHSIVGKEIPFCLDSVDLLKNDTIFSLLKFPSKNKAHNFCMKVSKSYTNIEIKVAVTEGKIKKPIFDISWFDKLKEEQVKNHLQKIKETEHTIKINEGSLKGITGEKLHKREATIVTLKDKVRELEAQVKEFSDAIDRQRDTFMQTVLKDLQSTYTSCQCNAMRECTKLGNSLPIYSFRTKILETIHKHQVCVLIGETGSGKSTQLPGYLYETTLAKSGTIVCTQPRKIAAITLAKHTSEEMNLKLGKEIGYRVGRDDKSCRGTKLLYMTDHALLNECVKDPYFGQYSCVIIDEAHERSIHTDLLLGMVREAIVSRPELKVIITSATIDPYTFVKYFGGEKECPIIKVPGCVFPVETIYSKDHRSVEDDHIENIVTKVLEIHRKNKPGNILAFLATPLETEKAEKLLQQKASNMKSIKTMQLHGRLQPTEQQAVFEPVPHGCRKVIFSTNVAETSVTIPDIGIVIDTGLAKEKKYDAKKNMSVLEIEDISQSSANQRKGRAGRTGPGTCYRLYTEEQYKTMAKSALPEIMRINLGQAILKLVELGVIDPLKFHFVQTPSREALQLAMNGLYEIGAINKLNGKLTKLGKQLAKISLEPRFGKAVIKGIELGIGNTMTLVVAYASCGNSLFHRRESKGSSCTADCLKLDFCKEEGDFMTFLNVYNQWESLNGKEKTQWCIQNSVNGKTLKIVKDLAGEIRYTIKKELSMRCQDTQEKQNETLSQIITEIIMLSFPDNICRYSEHQNSGYAMMSNNMCVKIHPSSALQSLSHTPKWIVFTMLLKTSQDFALNVLPVPEDLVNKLRQDGQLHFNEAEVNERILQSVHVGYFSDYILNQLVGPRHNERKALQDNISEYCNNCPVNIDIDFNKGSCVLYIPANYVEYGTHVLTQKTDEMKDEMIRETSLCPIDKDRISSVMALIGRGGTVQHILKPDEFLSFQFKCKNIYDSDEMFKHFHREDYLASYEEVDVRGEIHVKVSFIDPRAAACAFSYVKQRFEAWTSQTWRNKKTEYVLRLSWIRRPLKGFGVCMFADPSMALLAYFLIPKFPTFLPGIMETTKLAKRQLLKPEEFVCFQFKCENTDESDEILEYFLGRYYLEFYEEEEDGSQIKVTVLCSNSNAAADAFSYVNKRCFAWPNVSMFPWHNIEYLSEYCRVSYNITFNFPDKYSSPSQIQNEFTRFVADHCQIANIDTIVVPRVHGFETKDAQMDLYERKIRKVLHKLVPTFYLDMPIPKYSAPYMTCWVTLSNASDWNIVSEVKSLSIDDTFSDVMVCVIGSVHITKNVLQVIKNEVECIVEKKNVNTSNKEPVVVMNISPRGHAKINLKCSTVNDFDTIKAEFGKIACAEEIDCQQVNTPEYQLFETDSINYLYKKANETHTYIYFDRINSKVKIYGTPTNKSSVLQHIYQYLLQINDTEHAIIQLSGPDKPPGVLRAIVRKYGVDMDVLRKEYHLMNLKLNLRRHTFEIRGQRESIQTFDKAIESIIEELSATNTSFMGNKADSPICSVCFCPVESKVKRLQDCGHGYCPECLTALVQSAIKSQNIPITCAHEECNSYIVLKDLQIVLQDLGGLVRSSVESYVKKNPDKVKPCSTPDCEVVFHTTDEVQVFTCPQCHVETCTKCGLHAHENGGDCKEVKITEIDTWIQKDKKKRGSCPKCKTKIEKVEGCYHITCTGCNKHVCWRCKNAYFETSKECYDHLPKCGGIF